MHTVDILPIAFSAIVFGVLVLNLGYGYLREEAGLAPQSMRSNTFFVCSDMERVRSWLDWYLTSVICP